MSEKWSRVLDAMLVVGMCVVLISLWPRFAFWQSTDEVESGFSLPDVAGGVQVVSKGEGADTLRVFADYNCPFCLEQEGILDAWVSSRRDDVTVEYYAYPLDTAVTSVGFRAAALAVCARRMGIADQVHESLTLRFAKKDRLADESAEELVPAGAEPWSGTEDCVGRPDVTEALRSARRALSEAGVRSTPTMEFQGTLMRGIRSVEYLDSLLTTLGAAEER